MSSEPRRIVLAPPHELADPEFSTIRARRDVADLLRRIQVIERLATPTDAIVLLAYCYLETHPEQRKSIELEYMIEQAKRRPARESAAAGPAPVGGRRVVRESTAAGPAPVGGRRPKR